MGLFDVFRNRSHPSTKDRESWPPPVVGSREVLGVTEDEFKAMEMLTHATIVSACHDRGTGRQFSKAGIYAAYNMCIRQQNGQEFVKPVIGQPNSYMQPLLTGLQLGVLEEVPFDTEQACLPHHAQCVRLVKGPESPDVKEKLRQFSCRAQRTPSEYAMLISILQMLRLPVDGLFDAGGSPAKVGSGINALELLERLKDTSRQFSSSMADVTGKDGWFHLALQRGLSRKWFGGTVTFNDMVMGLVDSLVEKGELVKREVHGEIWIFLPSHPENSARCKLLKSAMGALDKMCSMQSDYLVLPPLRCSSLGVSILINANRNRAETHERMKARAAQQAEAVPVKATESAGVLAAQATKGAVTAKALVSRHAAGLPAAAARQIQPRYGAVVPSTQPLPQAEQEGKEQSVLTPAPSRQRHPGLAVQGSSLLRSGIVVNPAVHGQSASESANTPSPGSGGPKKKVCQGQQRSPGLLSARLAQQGGMLGRMAISRIRLPSKRLATANEEDLPATSSPVATMPVVEAQASAAQSAANGAPMAEAPRAASLAFEIESFRYESSSSTGAFTKAAESSISAHDKAPDDITDAHVCCSTANAEGLTQDLGYPAADHACADQTQQKMASGSSDEPSCRKGLTAVVPVSASMSVIGRDIQIERFLPAWHADVHAWYADEGIPSQPGQASLDIAKCEILNFEASQAGRVVLDFSGLEYPAQDLKDACLTAGTCTVHLAFDPQEGSLGQDRQRHLDMLRIMAERGERIQVERCMVEPGFRWQIQQYREGRISLLLPADQLGEDTTGLVDMMEQWHDECACFVASTHLGKTGGRLYLLPSVAKRGDGSRSAALLGVFQDAVPCSSPHGDIVNVPHDEYVAKMQCDTMEALFDVVSVLQVEDILCELVDLSPALVKRLNLHSYILDPDGDDAMERLRSLRQRGSAPVTGVCLAEYDVTPEEEKGKDPARERLAIEKLQEGHGVVVSGDGTFFALFPRSGVNEALLNLAKQERKQVYFVSQRSPWDITATMTVLFNWTADTPSHTSDEAWANIPMLHDLAKTATYTSFRTSPAPSLGRPSRPLSYSLQRISTAMQDPRFVKNVLIIGRPQDWEGGDLQNQIIQVLSYSLARPEEQYKPLPEAVERMRSIVSLRVLRDVLPQGVERVNCIASMAKAVQLEELRLEDIAELQATQGTRLVANDLRLSGASEDKRAAGPPERLLHLHNVTKHQDAVDPSMQEAVCTMGAEDMALYDRRRQMRNILFTQPVSPQAGECLEARYRPDTTVLRGRPKIFVRAVWNRLELGQPAEATVPLLAPSPSGDGYWSARLKVPKDACSLEMSFYDDAGRVDNNRGLMYRMPVKGTGAAVTRRTLRVAHIAASTTADVMTGGVGSTVSALATALRDLGHDVVVVAPKSEVAGMDKQESFVYNRVTVHVWKGAIHGLCITMLEPGVMYGCNSEENRLSFFCGAARQYLHCSDPPFDIVQCHDWQAAPAVSGRPSSFKTIFTVHSLSHGAHYVARAMQDCTAATTVSATYAEEIRVCPGVVEHYNKLYPILNGYGQAGWDPSADPYLPLSYTRENAGGGKDAARRRLCDELCLPYREGPLVACVTRLVEQKGLDIIKDAARRVMELGGQFILLGWTSEEKIEEDFFSLRKELALDYPGRSAIVLKQQERLAHLAFAGSDIRVMPSIVEPCGVEQLIAMRYGTVPVVRKTGGLVDTVYDVDHDEERARQKGLTTNGFAFKGEDVLYALERAFKCLLSEQRRWNALRGRCMAQSWSWSRTALDYVDVYYKALRS